MNFSKPSRNFFRIVGIALHFIFFAVQYAQAQDSLILYGKTWRQENQILVRWVPGNYESLRKGVEAGYFVKRYTRSIDGVPLNTDQYLASVVDFGVVTAAPEQDWEAFAAGNDLAGVAAGCLYGDSLDVLPAGGATLTNIYNKSKEKTTRFGWSLFAADQDFVIAQMMGLGLADQSAKANEAYEYRVEFGESAEFVRNAMILAPIQESMPEVPAPRYLSAIAHDKGALVQWEPDGQAFSSFDIERSDDGGNTFHKINTAPIVYTYNQLEALFKKVGFVDSLADNSTIYIYRVVGRNAFGISGPPSDTLHVKGVPARLLLDWTIASVRENETEIVIDWSFPTEWVGQITRFEVWRGAQQEGPFEKINDLPLGNHVRTFTDRSPARTNYYVVKAFDLNQYGYATIPYLGQPVDHTPPNSPINVHGSCSETGILTLHWSSGGSNDEMGYRVYFSHLADDSYQQLTSVWIKDTFFTQEINLQTLTEDIWLGVKAIDYRHNQSAMSAPYLIKRPDIVPPDAPSITNFQADFTGIHFQFGPSSSADVVNYRFERRRTDIPGWTLLTEFSPNDPLTHFSDLTGDKRKRYEYRLLAIDDAGLTSSSAIVKAQKIDDGLRGPILNFVGQAYNGERIAQISWDYAYDRDLIGFEVYRGVADSTRKRSYVFVPYPNAKNTNPGIVHTVSQSGNMIHAEVLDYDADLRAINRSQFAYFGTHDAVANQSIPAITNPAASGTYTLSNPNNLANQNPNNAYYLYYWVVARYADGASSPIAGYVAVLMN